MKTRKVAWSRATTILPIPADATSAKYLGNDLLLMSKTELQDERSRCIEAIEADAPCAHAWYFNRLRRIEALLSQEVVSIVSQ